ncbi:MAG: HDOD domain-containing protein [Candidatus Marinimicrobia bacterium]|nr:HDOD domain-containing protein [Candidatus Neomarinimicrobiota bacterium]
MMNKREEIIKKLDTIQSIPAIVSKVYKILKNRDELDFKELVRMIEYDPGLTTNILKYANSAFYGFKYKISSLHQALIRIGMDKIFDIVVAAAVGPILKQSVKGYDLPRGKLWEHSIGVAIGSEQLAKELNIQAPNYLFTAGLLIDIGKIVLGSFVDVDAQPIIALAFEKHIPFDVAERRVLGIDHTEVGALLLEKWGIPEEIVMVERWHHQPDRYEGDKLVVDLVHTADTLTMIAGIGGYGTDGLNYRPSPEVSTRLGLTRAINEKVIAEIIGNVEKVYEMLTI